LYGSLGATFLQGMASMRIGQSNHEPEDKVHHMWNPRAEIRVRCLNLSGKVEGQNARTL
jgi:hypothetical protein